MGRNLYYACRKWETVNCLGVTIASTHSYNVQTQHYSICMQASPAEWLMRKFICTTIRTFTMWTGAYQLQGLGEKLAMGY